MGLVSSGQTVCVWASQTPPLRTLCRGSPLAASTCAHTHTHTSTRAHTQKHMHTHICTHTHTQALLSNVSSPCRSSLSLASNHTATKTINGVGGMKAGVGSPVGHQGVLLPPEHDAHISGMVFGGVEIRVVTWVENHVCRNV